MASKRDFEVSVPSSAMVLVAWQFCTLDSATIKKVAVSVATCKIGFMSGNKKGGTFDFSILDLVDYQRVRVRLFLATNQPPLLLDALSLSLSESKKL